MKRKLFVFDASLAGFLILAVVLSSGVVSFGGAEDDLFGGDVCGKANFSTVCKGGTNPTSTKCSRRSCVIGSSTGTLKNQQEASWEECGNSDDCGTVSITKDCVKSGP
jgi:hypothetical protein